MCKQGSALGLLKSSKHIEHVVMSATSSSNKDVAIFLRRIRIVFRHYRQLFGGLAADTYTAYIHESYGRSAAFYHIRSDR